jgi:hypothetical protein
MNTTRRIRPRLRAVLALGAVALLAFAGLAVAKDRGGDRSESTGTITAFDTGSGELTIKTTAGDSFTALLTSRTKVRCEDERGHGRHRHSSGSRRDSGSGSGDDNGGRGEADPGDDNGAGVNCGADDLSVGAAVHEAELEIEHGSARWDEIELTAGR